MACVCVFVCVSVFLSFFPARYTRYKKCFAAAVAPTERTHDFKEGALISPLVAPLTGSAVHVLRCEHELLHITLYDRTHMYIVGCILHDYESDNIHTMVDCNATLAPHRYQYESAARKWTDMSRQANKGTCYLLACILGTVMLVMSGTSVPKPPKTAAEHADDADTRRRGAMARRPVNSAGYHKQNSKLEAWHRYSGAILVLLILFIVGGTFAALDAAGKAVDLKSGPWEGAATACRGKPKKNENDARKREREGWGSVPSTCLGLLLL